MYYVYMLKCAGGSFYTGYTPELCRRMRAHMAGKGGSYTRAHPPEELVGLWECPDATAARRLEYAVKHRLDRKGKELLLLHPDTVNQLFPHLAEYVYVAHCTFTLEDCLEGSTNG